MFARVHSQVISILRQELDSLVRVVYLLSVRDHAKRARIMTSLVEAGQWKDAGKRITDREMVDLADTLHGWTKSVYRFGCAYIHLSNMHDHSEHDPLSCLSEAEKADILRHMRAYHGGPHCDDCTMADLVPYLPAVFDKIAGNLECYVAALEKGRGLED